MTFSKKIALIALTLGAIQAGAIAGQNGTLYSLVSTNGVGLGYAKSVNKDVAIRGQFNLLPKTSYSGNVGDFGTNSTVNVDAVWKSVQLVGDWYPSANGFRISGGVIYNKNKITVAGQGDVNGKTATVNAEIEMCCRGLAPYIGIGYSTRPKDAKGLGFIMDLGVMLQDPKSKLSATGAGITAADIAAQNAKVTDAIKKLKYFPVVGVGISYAF